MQERQAGMNNALDNSTRSSYWLVSAIRCFIYHAADMGLMDVLHPSCLALLLCQAAATSCS
jgi:hypothetical protein